MELPQHSTEFVTLESVLDIGDNTVYTVFLDLCPAEAIILLERDDVARNILHSNVCFDYFNRSDRLINF